MSRLHSLARHYGHLLGGHYLFISMMAAITFLPAPIRDRMLRQSLKKGTPTEQAISRSIRTWARSANPILATRCEFLAILALLAIAWGFYGPLWPALVIVVYLRGLVFSVLDNLPHYGTHGDPRDAALNLSLPRWTSLIVMQHNWHQVHHQNPELDWLEISRSTAGRSTQGSYWVAALRQFGGPKRY